MYWIVYKTGAVWFDALHAYGLAILLAAASARAVQLQDEGVAYRLSISLEEAPRATPEVLSTMLRLPTVADLAITPPGPPEWPLAIANLDGMLAALFTQTGLRVASVADLLHKQQRTSSALAAGLSKAKQAADQWRNWAEREGHPSPFWLGNILRAYQEATLSLPVFSIAQRRHHDLSIWLTLDPALGFSTRRSASDGYIHLKTNLTLSVPRFGVLLARIGAARFLRAQSVANQRINYYLPLATSLTLHPESALPPLSSSLLPVQHALGAQYLRFVRPDSPLDATWLALAYQTLLLQDSQQAISLQSGLLPFDWITTIAQNAGYRMIDSWRSLLQQPQDALPYELDTLLTCLQTRREAAWLAHLRDYARAVHFGGPKTVRRYSLHECKELTMSMIAPTPSPLRSILERKQGTLRFGQALRLLGQANHARLVETLELLESVSTLEKLLQILQQAVQACALASAKSPFILVPSEEDLAYLLDDVAQHGVRLIASLLLILAALRYPLATSEAHTQTTSPREETADLPEGEDQSHLHLEEGAPDDDHD